MKKNILKTEALAVEKDLYQAHKGEKWLYKFYSVDQLPEGEPYDSIRMGYKQKDIKSRVWSMLVNGCISSGRKGFALSQSSIVHYFNADPNIHITSLKGSVYSNIRDFLSKCSTFEVYDPGSGKKEKIEGKFRPRTYRIVSPEVLTEIDKNITRLSKSTG